MRVGWGGRAGRRGAWGGRVGTKLKGKGPRSPALGRLVAPTPPPCCNVQWFVLVSDTTVPLYSGSMVWQQLMHERKSRIDACYHDVSDGCGCLPCLPAPPARPACPACPPCLPWLPPRSRTTEA